MRLDDFDTRLPNGKRLSRLGFGCSSLWSKADFPHETALDILRAAEAAGINHFDTAPSYAEGEVRLGAYLKQANRDKLVISTKVGTEADGTRSFDVARMRASVDASLARLGVAKVDILYLHGPSASDLDGPVLDFFEDLKAQGKISYSGVNSFDPDVVAATVESPIDAVMLQYNIVDRRFDALIDRLDEAGKIVIAGTILAQGIASPSTFLPRDKGSLWYLARSLKNDPLFLLRGRRMSRRIERTGMAPHEASIRFCLSNPAIDSNLFGTRSLVHMQQNLAAADRTLSAEQIKILKGLA